MIKIRELKFSYNDKKIINSLSLDIVKGTTTFIKGSNGIGKTTLIKLILAKLKPDSGSISITENPIISYIPVRTNGLYQRLSGEENIDLFASLLKLNTKQRVKTWLDSIPLFKMALETEFSKCSMGMKQILNLFILTLNNPDLIIGDEVFKHFDNETKTQIINILIDEFPKATFIFVTHESLPWPLDYIELEEALWS